MRGDQKVLQFDTLSKKFNINIFLIVDWTNIVLHDVMYTDKMIALSVVMMSSWCNCLLSAWEMESLKFEYHALIKFLLKERCKATAIYQRLVESINPSCVVTLH